MTTTYLATQTDLIALVKEEFKKNPNATIYYTNAKTGQIDRIVGYSRSYLADMLDRKISADDIEKITIY